MKTSPRDFAVAKHGAQRYGSLPYVAHLDLVVGTILTWRPMLYRDLITAAYLHDVLEDTDCTEDELIDTFGLTIAELVKAVTNPTTPEAMLNVPGALILKAADRYVNVCAAAGEYTSIEARTSLLRRYRTEQPKYLAAAEQNREDLRYWIRVSDALTRSQAL